MKEKRISLRFREDNEIDMKVWELLESAAKEKNASKNSIVIELILSALEHKNSDDAFAERIAEMVADKLGGMTIQREAPRETDADCEKRIVAKSEPVPRADEPEFLGEDAVGFLDIFG
ncbi:MAG: hypothetical protein MJ130_09505 [Lachnospiraceae bacterium]|nr:hypothetical protein [Lachnospiraceae bacterium]